MTRALLTALILALGLATSVHADEDCQSYMAQLSAARTEALNVIDAIDALEAAIAAPTWDPVGDAWMVDSLDGAYDELIGALNAAAIAEELAHAAHCY